MRIFQQPIQIREDLPEDLSNAKHMVVTRKSCPTVAAEVRVAGSMRRAGKSSARLADSIGNTGTTKLETLGVFPDFAVPWLVVL